MPSFVIRVRCNSGASGFLTSTKNKSALELYSNTARKFSTPADAACYWHSAGNRLPTWTGRILDYDPERELAFDSSIPNIVELTAGPLL